MLRVDVDEVRVHHREDLGQHLEHCDLGAEGGEHRGELHADHPTSDHREALGDLLQLKDLVGVDGVLGALQRNAGDRRPGGDDDVLGLDRVIGDLDSALAAELACTAIDGDAASLQQPLNALD